MEWRGRARLGMAVLAAGVMAGVASLPWAVEASSDSAGVPYVFPVSGAIEGTHDPSIARDGKTWYVFATGKAPEGGQFAVRCSENLTSWRRCGQVFGAIPEWIASRSPKTTELWAPEVRRVGNEYRMYYAYSLFGKNTSGIGLAVTRTLDPGAPGFGWVDKGLVLESRATDNFNAIDPAYVEDAEGHGWLAFGSFWDGIKMRRLDDRTGLLSATDRTLYSLARRATGTGPRTESTEGLGYHVNGLPPDSEAIEAPSLLRHGGYFYLFTSWDLCCRGAKSTYHTMVGRATAVTGPYLDESGRPLLDGGGTPVLLPNARWAGPGGETAMHVAEGGTLPHGAEDLLVYHAYDPQSGRPSLQVSTIAWKDGWPVVGLAGSPGVSSGAAGSK